MPITINNNVTNIQINLNNGDVRIFPKLMSKVELIGNRVFIKDVMPERTETVTLQWQAVSSPLEPNNTALRNTIAGYLETGIGAGGLLGMNILPVSNLGLEVARGNVPGMTGIQIASRSEKLTTTWSDMWGPGGTLDYPTSGEQWEIVGASVNDSSTGTGLRTALVQYLDDNYVLQFEILTMNGTTPVTFVATDSLRFRVAIGLTWGSSGENQDEITIQPSGGGNPRGSIDYARAHLEHKGQNFSFDGHYTVEAGKTFYPNLASLNAYKGVDMAAWSQVRPFGSTDFVSFGETPTYQNTPVISVADSYSIITEKTDFRLIGISTNADVTMNLNILGLLETN